MTRPLPHLSRREGLILALILGLVALLTAAYWNYTQDDVFITYVYSRSLAEGHGFVFNPGERVQGTTTPLYALLMAGAYAITPDLLHAGNLLSGLFLAAAIMLAWSLTRRWLSLPARALLALTLAASPLVYVSWGMETLLACALLMAAFWLWERDRRPAALLAAAALTWTRADGVVLAGALGLAALWDARAHLPRALPWKLAALYLAGIAPWFLFAWAYFGMPLPQTFRAKEELFAGLKFWHDGRMWWESFYGNNPPALIVLPLALLGAGIALRQPRLRPLALWPILYLAGYTALNVTAFWYYTPLLTGLIVLAALGGDALARRAWRAGRGGRIAAVGLAALALIAGGLAVVRAWDYRTPPPRMATYRLVGEWIAAHTPPDAQLMVKDLGVVGYYARRHALDTFGLIVPALHYPQDNYAVAKYKPEWLVTTQYWEMQRLAAQDWFRAAYVPVAQFSTPGDVEFSPMTVYRRRLALEPPAQAVQGFDLPLACTVTLGEGDPLPAETRARLLSESGAVLGETAQPFLAGQYPAPRAAGEEHLVEQIALPLAVPPGRYGWELECGGATLRGTVGVLPLAEMPGYQALRGADWPGHARLQGFALPEGAQPWAGGSLALALDWQISGPPAPEDSVFVHLRDTAGRVVAQADGPPPPGSEGTRVDVRRLRLPADLPAGDYELALGWYNWQTEARYARADGSSDALVLPLTVRSQWPGGSGLP